MGSQPTHAPLPPLGGRYRQRFMVARSMDLTSLQISTWGHLLEVILFAASIELV